MLTQKRFSVKLLEIEVMVSLKVVIPKRGLIARRTCCLPANSRFLTGLSARFGMTSGNLLKLTHYRNCRSGAV
jgi:hypothetical protein